MNTREYLISVYVDFVNNYLTIETWADHHGLRVEEALLIIRAARMAYNNPHPDA